MDCSLSGSSVHGILQARILEWVAVPFSRVSSQLNLIITRSWISQKKGQEITFSRTVFRLLLSLFYFAFQKWMISALGWAEQKTSLERRNPLILDYQSGELHQPPWRFVSPGDYIEYPATIITWMEGQHAPRGLVTEEFPHQPVDETWNSSTINPNFRIKCHPSHGRSWEFCSDHYLPLFLDR